MKNIIRAKMEDGIHLFSSEKVMISHYELQGKHWVLSTPFQGFPQNIIDFHFMVKNK